MKTCTISVYLAYAMAAYCLTCLFYLAFTQCMQTPFKSSLTQTQQRILNKSKYQRRNVFLAGLCLSSYLLFFLKPFKDCTCNCGK